MKKRLRSCFKTSVGITMWSSLAHRRRGQIQFHCFQGESPGPVLSNNNPVKKTDIVSHIQWLCCIFYECINNPCCQNKSRHHRECMRTRCRTVSASRGTIKVCWVQWYPVEHSEVTLLLLTADLDHPSTQTPSGSEEEWSTRSLKNMYSKNNHFWCSFEAGVS